MKNSLYEASMETYAHKSQGLIPDVPPPVQDLVAIAEKTLSDTPLKLSMAHWTWVCNDGTTYTHIYAGACHFYLQTKPDDYGALKGKQWAYVVDFNSDNLKWSEAAEAFYSWLYGPESPYRSIMDRVVVIDRLKGVVISTDTPANVLYSFCVSRRFPWEAAKACKRWYEWVKQGVQPGLAYWAIWFGSHQNPNTNHQAFDTAVSDDYVRNFCLGITPRASALYKDRPLAVKPCNILWTPEGEKATVAKTRAKWFKLYPDLATKVSSVSNGWGAATVIAEPPADSKLIKILLQEQVRLGLTN